MKSFDSESQSIDFSDRIEAAKIINAWVEKKTNNKIQNLISDDILGNDTRMVLVNAIYFKGLWALPFNASLTFRGPFFFNGRNHTLAEYMKMKNYFSYGNLTDLDATAVALPYKDSNMSMLFILPNSRTGLPALEKRLDTIDFKHVYKRMHEMEVIVEIPKFKIEFDANLNEPLNRVKVLLSFFTHFTNYKTLKQFQMGMKTMFTKKAKFDNLFEKSEGNDKEELKISQVIHKAFIEINEQGAEGKKFVIIFKINLIFFLFNLILASGATAVIIRPASVTPRVQFIARRPFFFAIIDTENPHIKYFIGRVTNFFQR